MSHRIIDPDIFFFPEASGPSKFNVISLQRTPAAQSWKILWLNLLCILVPEKVAKCHPYWRKDDDWHLLKVQTSTGSVVTFPFFKKCKKHEKFFYRNPTSIHSLNPRSQAFLSPFSERKDFLVPNACETR